MTKRRRSIINLNHYPHLINKGENDMIIKLHNVRLAFPQLFEPRTVNSEGEPAYSACFIFPRDHKCVKELELAIKSVAEDKWGAKAHTVLTAAKAGDKLCLHDGDTKADYDGFSGNFYVSARSKTRPLVVDRDKTELGVSDGKPYAGCYVVASVELWAQDNNYGKRVNASLRGVQFYSDGDAFAGGAPANLDEFEDLAEGVDEDSLI